MRIKFSRLIFVAMATDKNILTVLCMYYASNIIAGLPIHAVIQLNIMHTDALSHCRETDPPHSKGQAGRVTTVQPGSCLSTQVVP